jgi:O-antigen/teichoic acid export membrane protein
MIENSKENQTFGVPRWLRGSFRRFRGRALTPGKAAVLENFVSLSFLQSANYLFPLITLPYLIRVVGYEKYGLIAFAQSFVQYFTIFADYGFNLSATRDISLHQQDKGKISKIFFSVLFIKIALMVAGLAVFSCIVFAFTKFSKDWLLFFLTFGVVLGRVLFPVWFFQGIEQMKYITLATFAERLTFTLLLFVFIRRPDQFLYVPMLVSIGAVIGGVSGLSVAMRRVQPRWAFPGKSEIFAQLKGGWYVFISTVSINGYTATRVFAVGLFASPAITGAYALAEKLMAVIQTFPLASLVQAMFPRLTSLYSKNRTRCIELMETFQRWTTLAYLVLVPPVFFLAPLIVRIVSGRASIEAVTVFRILLVAIFFINSNAFRIQFFLIAGMDRLYSRIHVLASAAGIAAIFASAYFFSYMGPPVSLAFVELGVLVATIYALRHSGITEAVCSRSAVTGST